MVGGLQGQNCAQGRVSSPQTHPFSSIAVDSSGVEGDTAYSDSCEHGEVRVTKPELLRSSDFSTRASTLGHVTTTTPATALEPASTQEKAGPTHRCLNVASKLPHVPGMYSHITFALSSSLFTLILGGDRAALNASMVIMR